MSPADVGAELGVPPPLMVHWADLELVLDGNDATGVVTGISSRRLAAVPVPPTEQQVGDPTEGDPEPVRNQAGSVA